MHMRSALITEEEEEEDSSSSWRHRHSYLPKKQSAKSFKNVAAYGKDSFVYDDKIDNLSKFDDNLQVFRSIKMMRQMMRTVSVYVGRWICESEENCMKIAKNYAQASILTFFSHYLVVVPQNVILLLEGTFTLEKSKSKWPTVINMCLQKLWKITFYITKHVKWCSISNRDHCGITSVIFNIFREHKYWWEVWLVRGSPSEAWRSWSVPLNWESNVRSGVLLDLVVSLSREPDSQKHVDWDTLSRKRQFSQ